MKVLSVSKDGLLRIRKTTGNRVAVDIRSHLYTDYDSMVLTEEKGWDFFNKQLKFHERIKDNTVQPGVFAN